MNTTYHSQSNELAERSNHNVRVYQLQYFVVERFDTNEIIISSILQDNLNVIIQKFFANLNQTSHSNNFTSTTFFLNQHESKLLCNKQWFISLEAMKLKEQNKYKFCN